MLLSDAIALGQGTVGTWESGKIEHCAFGMAGNAIGKPEWLLNDGDYDAFRAHWPWLKEQIDIGEGQTKEAMEAIYDAFDNEVMKGKVTFEKFLDWIRSIEPPAEPAPVPAMTAHEKQFARMEAEYWDSRANTG